MKKSGIEINFLYMCGVFSVKGSGRSMKKLFLLKNTIKTYIYYNIQKIIRNNLILYFIFYFNNLITVFLTPQNLYSRWSTSPQNLYSKWSTSGVHLLENAHKMGSDGVHLLEEGAF
ncbi:hypothetical protein [Methanobacterium paludis]|uniref:Uncharacterized protein n=1 Tax=Methanobacterium paludis (strain DSM 25820 / JCM 18151 / SWAN1) TaxID=868131 RepID=F6D3A6_METPW|nr:hypothetical protein [Methanobacterium paludis]AEG18698.1 hypothetical protein MSWAN_1687 [Methanobacterium paludis]